MCGSSKLVYNVSRNGANGDWYWEVITPERDIMARGLASSSAEARADALRAGVSYEMPIRMPTGIETVASAPVLD